MSSGGSYASSNCGTRTAILLIAVAYLLGGVGFIVYLYKRVRIESQRQKTGNKTIDTEYHAFLSFFTAKHIIYFFSMGRLFIRYSFFIQKYVIDYPCKIYSLGD